MRTIQDIVVKTTHPSWHPVLLQAIKKLPDDYCHYLLENENWLPGPQYLFRAFNLPFEKVRYILYGESPYPRIESANGYAFWDESVDQIWGEKGFSKQVNRATSLRNFLKMLLIAKGLMAPNQMTKEHVTQIDKSKLKQTLSDFFQGLIQHGFLLLNINLALTPLGKKTDLAAFLPFQCSILSALIKDKSSTKLILFGQLAQTILSCSESAIFDKIIAEHPYNLSFCHNPVVIDFFKPFNLLQKDNNIYEP